MATYRVPLEVEVAGQHNVRSRDLHPLSLEDQVKLVQLPGRQDGLKSIFKFEVLKIYF